MAKDRESLVSLLEKQAVCNNAIDYYYETEKFYLSLSEAEISSSVDLMCGVSISYALGIDVKRSDYWYNRLIKYFSMLKKGEPEYYEVLKKLLYLNIVLPQKGITGNINTFKNTLFTLFNKKIELPVFSITSNLPSVMNGGKDFSKWSKNDDFLHSNMRKSLEFILGRGGVGLADVGLCESYFEKGMDVSEKIMELLGKIDEIRLKGTPDIEFVIIALYVREQIRKGNAGQARDTLVSLKERFLKIKENRFIANLNAMLFRIDLRLNDESRIQDWLNNEAPKEIAVIKGLYRYRYLSLAMSMIRNESFDDVLIILSQLENYFKFYKRDIDLIKLYAIKAICYYRTGNDKWRTVLFDALNLSFEYKFIRTIADYGIAVLPLLLDIEWDIDKEFLSSIIKATRIEAFYYPSFLKKGRVITELLTNTECQVLKLICDNLSNEEIGEILGIKLSTVKTHISHIFQKLQVSRRSEAKDLVSTDNKDLFSSYRFFEF